MRVFYNGEITEMTEPLPVPDELPEQDDAAGDIIGAIFELAEMVAAQEEAILELAEMIGGADNG